LSQTENSICFTEKGYFMYVVYMLNKKYASSSEVIDHKYCVTKGLVFVF